ncbi:hypothetical protein Bca4012_028253 [Brassica carinata]
MFISAWFQFSFAVHLTSDFLYLGTYIWFLRKENEITKIKQPLVRSMMKHVTISTKNCRHPAVTFEPLVRSMMKHVTISTKNCRHPAVTFERISFAHMRGTSATKQAVKISCNSTRNINIQDIDHEP